MPVPPTTMPHQPPPPPDTGWRHEGVAQQMLLSLQPPAWTFPAADAAGAPLVVVGYDHAGSGGSVPEPGPGAPPEGDWVAGLAASDPLARLLAGWAPAASGELWFS